MSSRSPPWGPFLPLNPCIKDIKTHGIFLIFSPFSTLEFAEKVIFLSIEHRGWLPEILDLWKTSHFFCCEEPSILTVLGSQEDGSGCRMLRFFFDGKNVWRLKEFEKDPQPGIILECFCSFCFWNVWQFSIFYLLYHVYFRKCVYFCVEPNSFQVQELPTSSFPLSNDSNRLGVSKSTSNQMWVFF